MAGTLGYAWEKLYDAVRAMASGKADIRGRLYSAHVSMQALSMVAIPDAILDKRFKEIVSQLKGKGTVRDSLDAMTEDEASELANKIFDLFHDVKTEYDRQKLS
jgi:hypothetical protein